MAIHSNLGNQDYSLESPLEPSSRKRVCLHELRLKERGLKKVEMNLLPGREYVYMNWDWKKEGLKKVEMRVNPYWG